MQRRSWRYYIHKHVLFPLVGQSEGSAVVAGQSVDSGFDQNQSVFGVFVLSALLQVSADVECFLNETVNVLGDLGSTS